MTAKRSFSGQAPVVSSIRTGLSALIERRADRHAALVGRVAENAEQPTRATKVAFDFACFSSSMAGQRPLLAPEMDMTAVSIVGAGHCGCAFAADLMDRGVRVLLYAHPDHSGSLALIRKNGSLFASMMIEGHFRPITSTSLGDAVRFSRLIVITVPAYGHDDVIAELSRFNLEHHTIICIAGNFFSLAARRLLNAAAIIETSSSPYASRFKDAMVTITGIKAMMPIASLTHIDEVAVQSDISSLFSMPVEWRNNVLEIGFSCISGVLHPTPALMNAGWIESMQGHFYFYRQGMTNSVAKVMERIDQERLLVAEQYGLSLLPTVEVMNRYYLTNFTSLADFACRSEQHNRLKMTPENLDHRFLTQDIPHVLVPWYELGLKAGIECQAIRSIIHLGSLVHDVNYLEAGRTLRKLGLHNLSKEAILKVVA